MDAAIITRDLGKRYRLGSRASYGRLTEALWSGLAGRRGASAGSDGELWALRGVSTEVPVGQVLGVIGRNGSGKTTLLKILSRITEPTEGEADIRGRVASLLEVGTGFHPELTGRENVFLAGAVLGMDRAEVRRKFDEIVAFAELSAFMDTPVKRYSSGMYVRLAFAVAAHLEPEVLLVDEVLAVGDAAFQRKCLGRIGEVAGVGRTVLFVSHDMAAVERLCDRAILLREGRVVADGTPNDVVSGYLADSGIFSPVVTIPSEAARTGTGEARIREVRLSGDEEGDLRVRTGGPLEVGVSFDSGTYSGTVLAGLLVRDRYERYLCDVRSVHSGRRFEVGAGREYSIRARIPALDLYPGEYSLGVWIARPTSEDLDFVQDACHLVVEDDGSLLADGRLDPRWGRFFVRSEWDGGGA